MIRLVWIEDHIEGFRELVTKLRDKGIELIFAQNEEDVRDIDLEENDFFIIDNKIGNNSRLGSSIVSELRKRKDKRALFHTAYLPPNAKTNVVEFDKNRNVFVGFVEKDIPDFDNIAEFWDQLATKFINFFCLDDPTDALADEPINKDDYERLSNLTLNEFEIELKSVAKKNRSILDHAFGNGASMVIIPSDAERKTEVYYEEDEHPSSGEIVLRYKRDHLFPFVFRNDFRFDDVNCHGTTRKDRVRDYPHAVMTFGGQDIPIHFDTGADTSIFGEAFVNEVGNAKVVNPVPFGLWLHRTEHAAREISLTSVIKNPEEVSESKGPGHSVDVPGLMVSSWAKSDLQIHCSKTCTKSTSGNEICIYRARGLLGRDLYVKNKLKVTLLPNDSRIEVEED